MAGYNIAIINASSVVNDTEAAHVTAALQTQVSRDFAPLWGFDAKVTFVPKGQQPKPTDWRLVILDNSDEAGALGYHDLTPQGLPQGKIFAASDKAYGLSWSVTASHELLEMLVDPHINLTVFAQTTDASGRLYSFESADACEADEFGYKIGDVLVSDFVTPAWFEGWRTQGSAQFDYGRHITKPFQLLRGGYIGVFDVSGGGWRQIYADQPTYSLRPQVGSRRERRTIGMGAWTISTV